MKPKKAKITAAAIAAFIHIVQPAFAGGELLHKSDFIYAGAFRVPSSTAGCGDQARCSFHYGGTAPAFNAENNSLFLVGHDWNQYVAEIEIPALKSPAAVKGLETARFRQPFIDITRGHLRDVDAQGKQRADTVKIGGLLVANDSIIGTAYAYYDGSASQVRSHFVASRELRAGSRFTGMYTVGTPPSVPQAGFISGYMAPIPSEWQEVLGGPAVTGNAALGIISRSSLGPAAFVFDPAHLGKKEPVPADPLLYYPLRHPTLGKWDQTGPFFNGATEIKAVVFPRGFRSLIFIGRHGTGDFCYGAGSADPAFAAGAVSGAGKVCYDPSSSSKGTHAYPYRHQVWAYDVRDLVEVRKGRKNPWEIFPYETWSFDLPFQTESRSILGAAYDPETQRIFVSQGQGDGDLPVIHVFRIAVRR